MRFYSFGKSALVRVCSDQDNLEVVVSGQWSMISGKVREQWSMKIILQYCYRESRGGKRGCGGSDDVS